MTDLPLLRPDFDHIDLALSGGGFRATLFHLGVIGFLREYGLLDRTRSICSVSGGSVLAAHLVIHWPDYADMSDLTKFQVKATALTDAIRSNDVSGKALKRWYRRLLKLTLSSEDLATAYAEILWSPNLTRWDELAAATERPDLHILATHLNTGRACAFSKSGFEVLGTGSVDDDSDSELIAGLARRIPTSNQPIARAVAASSAFPPVFAPLVLDQDKNAGWHLLTDGGVYDNSGVNYLRSLYAREAFETGRSLVIISDAGRAFPASVRDRYDGLLSLAMRVTDAQGNRIARADNESALEFFRERGIPTAQISIHDDLVDAAILASGHSALVQRRLRTIRTELDQFSPAEVLSLYRHGYLLAKQSVLPHVRLENGADSSIKSVQQIHSTRSGIWTPLDHAPNQSASARMSNAQLEQLLENSDVLKKVGSIRRAVIGGLVGAIVFAFLGLTALSILAYRAGTRRAQGAAQYKAASGVLPIDNVNTAAGSLDSNWAAEIPLLLKVPGEQPSSVYYAITQTFGTLTAGLPHASGRLNVRTQGALVGARVYALIQENRDSPSDTRFVVTQQPLNQGHSQGDLKFASGRETDRVCLVIVAAAGVDMTEEQFKRLITVEVKTP